MKTTTMKYHLDNLNLVQKKKESETLANLTTLAFVTVAFRCEMVAYDFVTK